MASAVVLGSCRDATGVELTLTTDIDCRDMGSTAILASRTSAQAEPLATTSSCQPDGTIGTLVIVPASERDEPLQVRVITSIGVPIEQCMGATLGSSCIESRRRLHFIPHEMLRLPVRQELDCRGVACGETLTCRQGTCVSDAVPDACLADPSSCEETPPAKVLPVGPGKAYADPCAAIAAARAGDTIEVDAGTYTVSCPVPISLTVRGVGGRAVLRAPEPLANDKAILAVEGDGVDFTAENLEFTGAVTSGQTGSPHSGLFFRGRDLTVRGCVFDGNDTGLLTGTGRAILIEGSEFRDNGSAAGSAVVTHNVNIGAVETLTFRASWSHGAKTGHLIKSRARTSYILASRLTDGPDSTTSDNVDLPNGGECYLVGNLLEQANGGNSNMVRMGEEGNTYGDATRLVVAHNTFVNRLDYGEFVKTLNVAAPTVVNNLFLGGGNLPADSVVAGNLNRPISALSTDLVAADTYDYHLQAGAPAIDAGVEAAAYLGSVPLMSYVDPLQQEPRTTRGAAPDSGAFERD